MSHRLQVIVSDNLDRRLRAAAQRRRLSASAFVRQAVERAIDEEHSAASALDQLARLDAPTADLEQMLGEIEAGRRG